VVAAVEQLKTDFKSRTDDDDECSASDGKRMRYSHVVSYIAVVCSSLSIRKLGIYLLGVKFGSTPQQLTIHD
jgi:hypothetical protein